ncbi:MAG: Uma2 family endonuclease [Dysgonamonadaceae bacterium]|jgi:Uma2 family endonuclease|nr:Uma2 family endonuclease [Dysgonamonadaceae bacterium]
MITDEKKLKVYDIPEDKDPYIVNDPAGAYELPTDKLYTYADYLTWADIKMREIINGALKLFSAPSRIHARVTTKILVRLYDGIEKNKGKCHVYTAPFDVRFPKNGETADNKIYTVLQPDICVVCDLSKLDEKGCLGAPDIIVEVQSPSTFRYDLTQKFDAYESGGVREYWVVMAGHGITIYHLQEDGKYDNGTVFVYDAVVTSQVLEGLEISLKELFEDL